MTERTFELIDSHCHLDEVVKRGRSIDEVLGAAHLAGVSQMVTSGDGLEDSLMAAALAREHREIYFTVGWHPSNPSPPSPSQLDELRLLLREPKAVALGEIGLDHYFRPGYMETPPTVQLAMFRQLLEVAAECHKPVVIHQRMAQRELLAALDAGPLVETMLHCFQGGAEFAREATDRGLLCSFAGNLTFRSAADLQAAARLVPAQLLLVETDAPFLSPEPHRGAVCEPARVRVTAQWLATLRGECLDTIAAATTATARHFFGIPEP